MFDIYISAMESEKCSKDKSEIDMLIPDTVFHYILDGEGYFNGVKLSAGQFFSANRNDHMCYYPDHKNPWTYIWVRFYGKDCEAAMAGCGLEDGGHYGNFAYIDEVNRLLEVYNKLSASHNEDATLSKSTANMLMLLHMPPKAASDTPDSLRELHVHEIRKYIDENYYRKMTVEDIAKKYYLSRAYVRNIFVKYMGIFPKQYLQEVRMRRAAELLVETDTSVSLIAHSVGYDDPLLFSREFSKYYQISPSLYRKQLNC